MKLLLRLFISFSLVAVIVWYLGGLAEIGRLLRGMNPVYAVLVFIVSTLDRALMTFKWALLLHARGVYLPFLRGMKIYCASMIWGTFLPTSVGADAIRIVSTFRSGIDSNLVIASIIIERMIGFLSALLLGLLGLFFLSHAVKLDALWIPLWWITCVLLVGGMVAFGLSFSRSLFEVLYRQLPDRLEKTAIVRTLHKLHETYVSYKANGELLLLFFSLTVFEQLGAILNAWLIAVGLGVDVSLIFMAGVIPLSILISSLPVSLGGIGVFEGIFIVLMSLADISPAQAISISVIARVLQILSWSPWWIAYSIENNQPKLAMSKPTL